MTATSPPGRVLRDAGAVHLVYERVLDAPVARVWAAVTAPDLLERWFGRWSGDPATGEVAVLMTAEGLLAPLQAALTPLVSNLERAVEVPGAGHWLTQENPDFVTTELLDFLAG